MKKITKILLCVFLVVSILFAGCPTNIDPASSTPPASLRENASISFLNEEEDGRTVWFLTEDENTYIKSEEGELEDEVALVSGDAAIIMVYSKGANFPNRMVMGSEEDGRIYGIFSEFDFRTSSYSVELVTEKGESQMLSGLILNRNTFTLHKLNSDWSERTNARAERMIIAMGLFSSFALNLEKLDNDEASASLARVNVWGWIKKNVIKPALNICKAVAVTAIVVAIIVTPVVNFIAPTLALSAAPAWGVAATAAVWHGTLETVRRIGDGELSLEDIKHLIPDAGDSSLTTQEVAGGNNTTTSNNETSQGSNETSQGSNEITQGNNETGQGNNETSQGNNEIKASKPVIKTQPVGGVFYPHNNPLLRVQASSNDDGTLSYQWYANFIEDPNRGNGILLSGETGSTYRPTFSGTVQYFVVITNTVGTSTATETSNVVEVKMLKY